MSSREIVFSARRKDFRVDWFSGSGAGGQHRNKHQNCCRITHLESGLVGQSQEHRERPANQKAAFRRLVQKLVQHYAPTRQKLRAQATETIRTYHEPRQTVKDHRTGLTAPYKAVLNGDIDVLRD